MVNILVMLGKKKSGRPQRTLMDSVEELQSGGVTEEDNRDRVRWRQLEEEEDEKSISQQR